MTQRTRLLWKAPKPSTPWQEQVRTQEGCSHITAQDYGRCTCIPRMLYGVAIARLTQVMRRKLDRAQHQLFKKVLGLPNSAADEAVYLLTGLIPLSMQVDLDTLLVIGQIINLPHSRYEVRTLLHAITQSTPMMRAWENILSGYKLPDLHSLILQAIPIRHLEVNR